MFSLSVTWISGLNDWNHILKTWEHVVSEWTKGCNLAPFPSPAENVFQLT